MSDAPLTWNTLPIAGGTRALIEASAGTGKTWTITALYLRLQLQERLLPPQIVVTTFTNAAAQELRERVRARLLEALARADAEAQPATAARGEPSAVATPPDTDEIAHWLDARWRADPSQRTTDALHLRLALAEFDRAPISTLHGLCSRIIAEHGLATGGDFTTGAMTSGAGLDARLRDDAWRRIVQSPPTARSAGDLAWANAGYSAFSTALAKACAPGVDVAPIDLSPLQAMMTADNAEALRQGATSIRYQSRKTKLKNRLLDLAEFLQETDATTRSPDIREKGEDLDALLDDQVAPEALAAARKHPAIMLARKVLALLPADPQAPAKAHTLAATRQWLLSERERRLRASAQISFDAVIARVADALEGVDGAALAASVRGQWPIALVDEFQDTDARQFAILDRLWPTVPGAACAPMAAGRSPQLVMIGDPKQAIYAFRGGDIQAYAKAGTTAQMRMRLDVNRRSSAAYVAACNELFAEPASVLGCTDTGAIRYVPAIADAARPGKKTLTIDGQDCTQPLWIHERIPTADKIGNEDLRARALDACARHIAALLQERRHRIGDRLLAPGDVAVLLPANRDIGALRKRLAEFDVPCVGAGAQSVFASDSARDLQVILYAIARPHDEPAIRAALATAPFFGRDFQALRACGDDAAAWQHIQLRFAQWQRQWPERGVQAVLTALIAAQAERLGGRADSERRLTDLRHLGELLQARAQAGDGPQALLTWLTEQREGDGSDDDAGDERQLRVESDALRVRLMTLHACKGLQFPLVFLPLLWAHKGSPTMPLPLVREAGSDRRLLDLGGTDFAATLTAARREDLDERFRVLYVALTRAQYGCHVYALDHATDTDPLRCSALQAQLARVRACAGHHPNARSCPHIAWSQGWDWHGRRYVADTPPPPGTRQARTLALAPRPYAGSYSFSSLAHRQEDTVEVSGGSDESGVHRPAVTASDDGSPDHPQLATLEHWKGSEFGVAIHSVLERRAFDRPLTAQLQWVKHCLRENGIDPDQMPGLPARVAERLQAVLAAELRLADGGHVRLGEVPQARQCHEMSFRFALDGARMHRLREVCTEHGEPDLVPAPTPVLLRGTMRGVIDLVFEHEGRFHVLDWKSNWLGARLAAYAPDAIRVAMDLRHYRFQALLYTIALDRYLRSRLPDYDRCHQLGAAVYLFVRAVGLAKDAGVWTQRFPDALIAAADAVLAQSDAEVAA